MEYNPKADLLYLKELIDELAERVSKLEKTIPILIEAQELIYSYMKGENNNEGK